MKVFKWLFLVFIWLILFMSLAVTWSLLNLPETESIKISRQPSITFLDKEGRIIASYGDIYGQTIQYKNCLLYTSPSPRDRLLSRMPSSA